MNIRIETAKSGKPTLVLEREGRSLAIYSRHDPERDGRRFYNEYVSNGSRRGLFFFIGIGLAYHIAPFAADLQVERLIILEPDEGLFRKVRNALPVKDVLSSEKVEVHVGKQVDLFFDVLRSQYEYLFHEGFRVLMYPRLRQMYRAVYGSIGLRLREGLNSLLSDTATIGRFARLWLNNFIKNMGQPGELYPVSSLFSTWRGTAVLIGAGPSLNNVLDDLAAQRGRIYLIATDAALKPLFRGGIRPDLLVTVDPQPLLHYHVRGLRIEQILTLPVVLNILSSPHLFPLFSKKYLYFTLHPISRLFGMGRELLLNYTAVSSLAFHVAVEMGFDAIVLAGFDFSCTDMRAYARGTYFYDYCVDHGSRFRTPDSIELEVMHRRGEQKLEDYRAELETLIDRTRQRGEVCVFNWRSDGSEIRGAERVTSLPSGGAVERDKPGEVTTLALPPIAGLCRGEIRALVEETLALRNRIYRHVTEREAAVEQAHMYMQRICERIGKRF